jgi:hypothetical protein
LESPQHREKKETMSTQTWFITGASSGLAPKTQYRVFLSDTNEAPFKNLQPLAVLKTNPDGAGIVQAIGPLKTLVTLDGAAADVRRRFLIVSESDDASHVVLRQASNSGK